MSETSITSPPHPEGTLLRLTRDLTESWADGVKHQGQTFEAGEFYTAGNADEDEIPVDFYYGNVDGGGNNVCVPADAVEVAKTAEQMAARRIPTVDALRDAMASALLMDEPGFTCSESSPDGAHALEVYGQTSDGLPFAFTVQITSLYQADQ